MRNDQLTVNRSMSWAGDGGGPRFGSAVGHQALTLLKPPVGSRVALCEAPVFTQEGGRS